MICPITISDIYRFYFVTVRQYSIAIAPIYKMYRGDKECTRAFSFFIQIRKYLFEFKRIMKSSVFAVNASYIKHHIFCIFLWNSGDLTDYLMLSKAILIKAEIIPLLTNDKIEKILYPGHQIIGIFRASHYIGHTAVQKVMIIHLVLR